MPREDEIRRRVPRGQSLCLFFCPSGFVAYALHRLLLSTGPRLFNPLPVRLRTFPKLDTLSTGRGEWEVKEVYLVEENKSGTVDVFHSALHV